MASGNAILAGILGGLGGAGQAIGGGFAQAQRDELEREKLAQERDLRQQALDAQLQQITQQQSQFEATQKAQAAINNPDLAPLIKMGILPSDTGPMTKTTLDEVLKYRAAEDKRLAEEGALNTARSAIMNQPARPDVAMPAEGAMYSEAETLPGKAATPRNAILAAILGQPGAAAILDEMFPKTTYGTAAPGSALTRNGALTGETVPALPKENRLVTKTEVRPDGTYQITTDTITGETTATKIPGVPGQPQFAPQRPEQPNAAALYMATMQKFQQARDLYGEEDQRTKDLATMARGLQSRVDPETGLRPDPVRTVDPVKAAIAAMIAGKQAPGPGITPPAAAPAPALVPPAAAAAPAPRPPFPGGIRIIGPDGTPGWLRPGRPMPPGAQVAR